ncbi:MAG: hypothetical protein EHM67_03950 [Hyphomicrobiaceae bacterium]|nr:MAG: hypothetical protein EHM67_03950 [Hyphomicrobiaceae bacterium]
MFKVSLISLLFLPLTVTVAFAQANTMTSGRPSATLNPEQCAQVWSKAVPSGEYLSEANAAPYIVSTSSKLTARTRTEKFPRANLKTPAPKGS